MPSKTKLKNAAIAERSAALPKIPQELLDQIAQGATTAEAIQDVTMALKKALIERALGGELSHHLGYAPGGDKPAQAGNHRNGDLPPLTVPTDWRSPGLKVNRSFVSAHCQQHSQRAGGAAGQIVPAGCVPDVCVRLSHLDMGRSQIA